MISYKDAEKKQSEELQRLIEFFGSEYRLAKALELSPQAVNGWKKRGRISATMAKKVEEITKKHLHAVKEKALLKLEKDKLQKRVQEI